MKQLIHSGAVLALLVLICALGLLNTCQLDQLETRLSATQRQLEAVAAQHRRDAAQSTSAPSAEGHRPPPAKATDESRNLLEPNPRPFVTVPHVKGGTLRTAWHADPPGLNPYASAHTTDVGRLLAYVGNTLAARHKDDPDRWHPELALRVTTQDRGLSYEISLRQGVYWHPPRVKLADRRYAWLEGEHELTSDDVAFALDAVRNPHVGGRAASERDALEALDRYQVLDRYRIKVLFKQRRFIHLPTLLDLHPLPRWLYMHDQDGRKFDTAEWGRKLNEHWYNQKLIGTGPYRFVEWAPGRHIVLERNPRYFGEAPAFDRVIIRIIKDQSAYPRRLKAGELDFAPLRPEQYRSIILDRKGPILGDPRIRVATHPTLGYFYLGWNTDSPYFADKRVRQAMTLALDRERIIQHVFHGLGTLQTGPFPRQSPCNDPSIEPWPFDLKVAADKLEQAGWRDSDGDGIRDKDHRGRRIPFEFRFLLFGGSSEYRTLTSIYREALLQVGVRLQPRALEWSTFLKKRDEREFDAYTGSWIMPWEADVLELWHSRAADQAGSANHVAFRNRRADALAEALRSELDPDKRLRLCRAFHAVLHEEQPYTFLYQRRRAVLYWNHMNELEFSLLRPARDLRYFSFRRLPDQ